MKREGPIPVVVFGRLSRLLPCISRGLITHLETYREAALDVGIEPLSVTNIVVVSWTLPGHVTNANPRANFSN